MLQSSTVMQDGRSEPSTLRVLNDHARRAARREHFFFAIQPALDVCKFVAHLAKVKAEQSRHLSGDAQHVAVLFKGLHDKVLCKR